MPREPRSSAYLEFTFAPRHRQVTRSRPFPWLRVVATVAVGVVLGSMLLKAAGAAGLDQAHCIANAAIVRNTATYRDQGEPIVWVVEKAMQSADRNGLNPNDYRSIVQAVYVDYKYTPPQQLGYMAMRKCMGTVRFYEQYGSR